MKRQYALALGVVLWAAPLCAGADARFAQGSIFLSTDAPEEGETVLIHTVVSNSSAAAFSGTLVLSAGGAQLGSVPVSLKAGEADTVSISWKPAAGRHTVSATLRKNDAEVEKTSAHFTVAAKPIPQEQTAASIESSEKLQDRLADLSPAAADTAKPLFTLVDGTREKIADVIDAQLTTTKERLAPQKGEVAGAEDENFVQNPMGAAATIFHTFYLYLLTILKFLVSSAGIFYPLLAVAFFWGLWRLFKRIRRPAY